MFPLVHIESLHRPRRAHWWILLLLGLALLPAPAAYAQDTSSTVERFDVDIELNPDASFDVTERQTIRLAPGPAATFIRTIPMPTTGTLDNWSLSDGAQEYILVESSARPYGFSVTHTGDTYRIAWTYPPVAGEQAKPVTFSLGYTVHDALEESSISNLLWWIAIPSDHATPIEGASILVTAPVDTTIVQRIGRLLDGSGAAPELIIGEKAATGDRVLWELDQGLPAGGSFELSLAYAPGTPDSEIDAADADDAATDEPDADRVDAPAAAAQEAPDLSAIDFSGVVLTEDDLLPGYYPHSARELREIFQAQTEDPAHAPAVTFGFFDDVAYVQLLGLITPIPTRGDRITLDMTLSNPELMAEMFEANRTWGPEFSGYTSFDVGEVGEHAAGITALHEPGPDVEVPPGFDPTRRLDVITFRRSDFVFDLSLAYPEGQPPDIDLPDLARVWDARMVAALEQAATSEAVPASKSPADLLAAPITLTDLPDDFGIAPKSVYMPLLAEPDPTGLVGDMQIVAFVQHVARPNVVVAGVFTATGDTVLPEDAGHLEPAEALGLLQAGHLLPSEIGAITPLEVEPAGETWTALRFVVVPDAAMASVDDADMGFAFDAALFRFGDYLGVLMIGYPPDAEPAVSLAELLPVMAARVEEAQAALATPAAEATPAATPAPADESVATPEAEAVVTWETLLVRSGPGLQRPTLATLHAGDALEVIGEQYNCTWLQVITPDGVQGWVLGSPTHVTLNGACAAISEK